jgi:hypothetical protein
LGDVVDGVDSEISDFIEKGKFFSFEIIVFPKKHSRKNSYKLISCDKMIWVEDVRRSSIIIQSHDPQLTGEFHIILQFLDFIVDIIKFTGSRGIR